MLEFERTLTLLETETVGFLATFFVTYGHSPYIKRPSSRRVTQPEDSMVFGEQVWGGGAAKAAEKERKEISCISKKYRYNSTHGN